MGDESTIFATTDRAGLADSVGGATGLPATLVMISGEAVGMLFDLGAEQLLIGRGDSAGIRLEYAGVSRQHLVLRCVGEGYEAEDVGSRNGSFINDQRIEQPTALARGDLLRVGPVVLKYLPQGDPERIAYERLYRRSQLDRFTGCYSKSYFLERLDEAIARRTNAATDDAAGTLSLIIFDLDHFKAINDEHGHDAGDFVLRTLADLLRQSIPHEGDVLARYGGEEFVLLLPGTTLDAAVAIAESLRQTIQAQHFVYQDTRLLVTISAGVAEYGMADNDGAALFRRADTALYQAKHTGRNKVGIAQH